MTTAEHAYDEGVDANFEGQFLSANPYPLADFDQHYAWNRGHQSVQHIRDQWEDGNHSRARSYGD